MRALESLQVTMEVPVQRAGGYGAGSGTRLQVHACHVPGLHRNSIEVANIGSAVSGSIVGSEPP